MKFNKDTLSTFIIFTVSVIIIGILYSQKTALKIEKEDIILKQKLSEQYLYSKFEFEGKYIWETSLLNKSEFDTLIQEKNTLKPVLFFWYDSVGCSKCYELALRNLNTQELVKNLFILYNGHFSFLKQDFRGAKFYDCNGRTNKYNQVVFLVNPDGKILATDFLKYEKLEYNKKFYKIVRRYLLNGTTDQ